MAAAYDYDLVVIGAGSGGLSAAKRADKLGKRVAIAEKNVIGGTCVNRGCIPTKLMIYAAEFAKQQAIASGYGWVNPKGKFDWPSFKQAMDNHVRAIRQKQIEKLEGIDILRGQATFIDAHTLEIEGQKSTSEFVLIAVGGRPTMPDLPGIEHAIDSRQILNLETLPDSFLIAGGGYIGVEFSQVLRCYGRQVTLVESNPHVLDGFDQDIQARVKQTLIDDGIALITDTRLNKIEKGTDCLAAELSNGKTVKAGQILCALGRTANADTLNLAAVNIDTEKGMIAVDPQGRTQEPNIFAIGDCTATMLLTPVAKAEGTTAAEAMFGDSSAQVDYDWIPSAVFMHPEVAMAGLTEQAARDRYDQIEIKCNTFTPLKYAITSNPIEALIKLIIDPKTQKIIGIHMAAPRAADLVQALVPALKQGLTAAELAQTIGIHPSTGEELFCI